MMATTTPPRAMLTMARTDNEAAFLLIALYKLEISFYDSKVSAGGPHGFVEERISDHADRAAALRCAIVRALDIT